MINLANSLREKIDCSGGIESLNERISIYKHLLLLSAAQGFRPRLQSNLSRLNDLGVMLHEQVGVMQDLEEAMYC